MDLPYAFGSRTNSSYNSDIFTASSQFKMALPFGLANQVLTNSEPPISTMDEVMTQEKSVAPAAEAGDEEKARNKIPAASICRVTMSKFSAFMDADLSGSAAAVPDEELKVSVHDIRH